MIERRQERWQSECKYMADIYLENVTKLYPGNVRAVDKLTLKVRNGELITLVGPSGCGKTTVLRMIAGLEAVSEGNIYIEGRLVNGLRPQDRDVAMVFQNYALYPHLTVYQNLALGLKFRHLPKKEIDRKVRSAARKMGIDELLERHPRALSGGERQRVAVGRAIVRSPKAFLFDEPLSNLDAKLRVQMRAEFLELHRSLATTTIYVTHDQEEAMILGERVVVMKSGVIQQYGTSQEVYQKPVNRFVAGFIGLPPMNFLNGRLGFTGSYYYIDEGANRIRLPQRFNQYFAGQHYEKVILGIRPEDMAIRGEGKFAGEGNVLNVEVDRCKWMGNKKDFHVRTARHEGIVCRVDADESVRDGTRLTMHLNMDRVHIFEPGDEGVNIILTEAGGRASAT